MFNKVVDICLSILPLRFLRYHMFRVDKFVKEAAEEANQHGKKIIDVGSQGSPYRKYFDKADYFTQDIVQNDENSIDFLGDITEGLHEIPSGSFDYILCTQVLEHIRKPHEAFKEFNRILRSQGKILLTTHQCFEEHMAPFDFFRFTSYGLRYLGESNGFRLLHIAPHGGCFHVVELILTTWPIKVFFGRYSFWYYFYLTVFSPLILTVNVLCYFMDFLDREKQITLNYECIFEKI